MSTLNPVLSQGVAVEQPVATPSIASGVANIAAGFLGAAPKPRQPTQSERDNEALKPFADRIGQLSNIGGQDALRVARKTYTSFVSSNPGLKNEAEGLLESAGFTMPEQMQSVDDILVANVNEWAQQPENQHLVLSAYDPNETVAWKNLTTVYQQEVYRQNKLEAIRQQNEELKLTEENTGILSQRSLESLTPDWQKQAQDATVAFMNIAKNDRAGTSPEYADALNTMMLARNQLETQARAEAASVGILASDFEESLPSILAPIDSVIAYVDANRDNTANALTTVRNMESMELIRLLQAEGINASPESMRVLANMAPLLPQGAADKVVAIHDILFGQKTGGLNPDPEAAAAVQTDDTMAQNLTVAGTMLGGADVSTAEGQEYILDMMELFRAGGKTRSGPFAKNILDQLYGPGLKSLSQVVPSNAEIRQSYTAFAMNQIDTNRRTMEQTIKNTPGISIVLGDDGASLDFKVDRAVLRRTVMERLPAEAVPGSIMAIEMMRARSETLSRIEGMSDREVVEFLASEMPFINSDLLKARDNINTIMRNTNQIDPNVFNALAGDLQVIYQPQNDNNQEGSAGEDTLGAGVSGVQQQVYEGLLSRGMPEHIAQGFMMNFQDESGFRPGIEEAVPNVHGTRGRGLYQLTGSRRNAFEAKYGNDYSVDNQLDFLMEELNTTEAEAWGIIQNSQSAGEAGSNIVNHFLRPAKEHARSRSARYAGQEGFVPIGEPTSKEPVSEATPEFQSAEEVGSTAPQQAVTATESASEGGQEILQGGGGEGASQAAVQAAQQEYSALAQETQAFLIRLFGSEEAAIQSIAEKESV